jgi:diaminohydroxyphosphoribosylaminopyrimidine deaminase / 5-amino-6-(5-phosphoribosylamino)uracil reductase
VRQLTKQEEMDELFMARALVLAERGRGTASPNPCVGAVVVREGRVVGEGFHARAGEPHAEVHALREAGDLAIGATLYVTLEPCSHQGRTGPCADAAVNAGLAEVVVAVGDPNPLVAGRGIAHLREAGIAVRVGPGEAAARRLNEAFLFAIREQRPFIHLKWAMTLDGKSATANGESQWITGSEARANVHGLRAEADAILIGGATLRADDPSLTVRDFAWHDARAVRQPLRIVVTNQPVELSRKLFSDGHPVRLWFGKDPGAAHLAALAERGIAAEVFAGPDGLSWHQALRTLGQQEIRSLLVEAGPTLGGVLIRKRLVERVSAFINMRILGGAGSRPAVGGPDPRALGDAVALDDVTTEWCGPDLWLTGRVRKEGCLQD